MIYHKNYNLKNSFNLSCEVNQIWFPETLLELQDIFVKEPIADIVADCTNILCSSNVDKVINLTSMPKEIILHNNNRPHHVSCDANVKSSVFIQYLLSNKIGGYEDLYGLPGRLGSAIYSNAGSNNTCISDYLTYVIVLDKNGNEHALYKEDLEFKRRYSSLQNLDYIITTICFTFPKQPIDKIKLEKAKQHRKDFPKYPNAGGIFKNWHSLKPYAEQLIGLKIGDAEVSKMVNIIVNKGSGTFEDIYHLIIKIKQIVNEVLELEIKII